MKIKFSHHYWKLQGKEHVRPVLCHVSPIRIDENTPKELLWYDTLYFDKTGSQAYYELKPGDYVLLLFTVAGYGIFTTIRPRKGRYGDKLEYYSKHIGEEFEIVIKEETE